MDEPWTRRGVLAGLVGAGAWALTGCEAPGSPARRPGGRGGGAGSPASPWTTPYVPSATGRWATVDPEAIGWDPARLAEAVAYAGSHGSRTLAVAVDGHLLVEQTWATSPVPYVQDVASAQKSITSVLTRLARSKGLLSYDDPVTGHLGVGWSFATPAQEAAITLHHLVTMTSGLTPDLRYRAAPGTRWDYNTDAYQLVRLVLEHASGLGIEALTRAWLWGPIGVSGATTWGPRPGTGGFSVDAKGRRLWALTMAARDMVRFGLLVSRHGAWGRTQVVPRADLDAALATSQPLNPSYGELWWLNGKSGAVLPDGSHVTGPLVPSAPADAVAALGASDQKIYACPADRLVVTRQGSAGDTGTAGPSGFDEGLWSRLAAAMP